MEGNEIANDKHELFEEQRTNVESRITKEIGKKYQKEIGSCRDRTCACDAHCG